MALHLQECPDLADGKVFSVTKSDQLVEGAEEFVGVLNDLPLVEAFASAGHHLSEEMEGVNVLQDVGLPVRDEDHVQLVQWLVDEADVVLLDCGVLGAAVSQLREGEQQRLQPRASHFVKGPRQDGLAAPGTDRRSKDHHICERVGICGRWKAVLALFGGDDLASR